MPSTHATALMRHAQSTIHAIRERSRPAEVVVTSLVAEVADVEPTHLDGIERGRQMLEAELGAFERARCTLLSTLNHDTWSRRAWRHFIGAPGPVDDARHQVDLMADHMHVAQLAQAIMVVHARQVLEDASTVDDALAVLAIVEAQVEDEEAIQIVRSRRRDLLRVQDAYRQARAVLNQHPLRQRLLAEMGQALERAAALVQGHQSSPSFA